MDGERNLSIDMTRFGKEACDDWTRLVNSWEKSREPWTCMPDSKLKEAMGGMYGAGKAKGFEDGCVLGALISSAIVGIGLLSIQFIRFRKQKKMKKERYL